MAVEDKEKDDLVEELNEMLKSATSQEISHAIEELKRSKKQRGKFKKLAEI